MIVAASQSGEFTTACQRQVESAWKRSWFFDAQSHAFLEHLCVSGRLTKKDGLYFPTYELYAALDVPPPLSPSPSTGEARNGTRART
jgi:hypothetical protein